MLVPILVVLGYVPSAQAQTDVWSAVNGPDGGTIVWDLESLDDGTLLVAVSNGVHRSHDEGLTWERFSNGLTALDVRDIHVDTSGTVRVATYGQGLFSLSRQTMTWIPAGLESTFALSLLESEPGVFLAGGRVRDPAAPGYSGIRPFLGACIGRRGQCSTCYLVTQVAQVAQVAQDCPDVLCAAMC